MHKALSIFLLLLFVNPCFAQNKNSKPGDWYYYYGEESPDEYYSLANFGIRGKNYGNYCSKIISVTSNQNKTEIKLDSILRSYRDLGIPKSAGSDAIKGTSIFGEFLIFKSDSIFSKLNNSKFLWLPKMEEKGYFTFYENDSIGFKSKKIIERDGIINGFTDSLSTYEITLFKGTFPKEFNGPKKFYYTIANQLGFVEVPDLFQILLLNQAKTVNHFRLKFASTPKLGYNSLAKTEFYNFDIGDEFYFALGEGPGFRSNKYLSRINEKDSIKYSLFSNYYRPNSPWGSELYTSGVNNFSVNKIDTFRLPGTWTNSENWAYSNIFYLNKRVCIDYQNSRPYYFDSTYQVYTIFEDHIYYQNIIPIMVKK